jgi:hypothetical protein
MVGIILVYDDRNSNFPKGLNVMNKPKDSPAQDTGSLPMPQKQKLSLLET